MRALIFEGPERMSLRRVPVPRPGPGEVLIGVHAAVNHSNPAERIDVQEALALYTINAARIGFTGQDRGSLEVGKLGDFVVLGEDPFEVDPERIKDIPVEMTVVGGKIVYRH